jgi:predicted peptidase
MFPDDEVTIMRFRLAFGIVALASMGFATGPQTGMAQPPADPTAASRLTRVDFQTTVQLEVRMNYWLYLPPDYQQQPQWPLLVFLHGAGERGEDLERVKIHGPPKLIAEGRDFPMIVIAPQCATRGSWNGDAVAALTRHAMETYPVDPKRVYLTGLSMGGFGTWDAAAKHPELYAAIAPICGGGNPETVERHKQIPTWVFHGAKDNVVPLERSQQMVDALKAAGGDVKFTFYPEASHDSWTETYNNPEFYEWLLSHHRP